MEPVGSESGRMDAMQAPLLGDKGTATQANPVIATPDALGPGVTKPSGYLSPAGSPTYRAGAVMPAGRAAISEPRGQVATYIPGQTRAAGYLSPAGSPTYRPGAVAPAGRAAISEPRGQVATYVPGPTAPAGRAAISEPRGQVATYIPPAPVAPAGAPGEGTPLHDPQGLGYLTIRILRMPARAKITVPGTDLVQYGSVGRIPFESGEYLVKAEVAGFPPAMKRVTVRFDEVSVVDFSPPDFNGATPTAAAGCPIMTGVPLRVGTTSSVSTQRRAGVGLPVPIAAPQITPVAADRNPNNLPVPGSRQSSYVIPARRTGARVPTRPAGLPVAEGTPLHPPQGIGYLTVRVNGMPARATITVPGTALVQQGSVGRAPFESGAYLVEATVPGFPPARRRVEVRFDEVSVVDFSPPDFNGATPTAAAGCPIMTGVPLRAGTASSVPTQRRAGVGLPVPIAAPQITSAAADRDRNPNNLPVPGFRQSNYVIPTRRTGTRVPTRPAGLPFSGVGAAEKHQACLAGLRTMDNLSRMTVVGQVASEIGIAIPVGLREDVEVATGTTVGIDRLVNWVGGWRRDQLDYLCQRVGPTRPAGDNVTGADAYGGTASWTPSSSYTGAVGATWTPASNATYNATAFQQMGTGGFGGKDQFAAPGSGWTARDTTSVINTGVQGVLGMLSLGLQADAASQQRQFQQRQLEMQNQMAQQQMELQQAMLRAQQAPANSAAALQAQAQVQALQQQMLQLQTAAQSLIAPPLAATDATAMSSGTRLALMAGGVGLVGVVGYLLTRPPAPAPYPVRRR
jgi:hypothetical protein